VIDQGSAYATDEDVALRAPADFALLCPRDQVMAAGSDGEFLAADRWGLRAPGLGGLGSGLAAGQVVQLLGPLAAFGASGDALAVAAVGAGLLGLRRKGLAAGAGRPPGPVAGVAGVEYRVATLGPQLSRASVELARWVGIDESVAGRRAAELTDAGALRDAAVLLVLHRQYLGLASGGGEGDRFAAKGAAALAELEAVMAGLGLRRSGGVAGPRFGSRLVR